MYSCEQWETSIICLMRKVLILTQSGIEKSLHSAADERTPTRFLWTAPLQPSQWNQENMVTSSIIRAKCLLHKSELIWIQCRKDISPRIKRYSIKIQIQLPSRYTEDQSNVQTMMDLGCEIYEDTYGSPHLWVNGSWAVDCGFENTFDWQNKESGKQVSSKLLCICLPPSVVAPKLDYYLLYLCISKLTQSYR